MTEPKPVVTGQFSKALNCAQKLQCRCQGLFSALAFQELGQMSNGAADTSLLREGSHRNEHYSPVALCAVFLLAPFPSPRSL